jgi:hypothetical protein
MPGLDGTNEAAHAFVSRFFRPIARVIVLGIEGVPCARTPSGERRCRQCRRIVRNVQIGWNTARRHDQWRGEGAQRTICEAAISGHTERRRVASLDGTAQAPTVTTRTKIQTYGVPGCACQHCLIPLIDMRERPRREDGDIVSGIAERLRLLDDTRIGTESARSQDADAMPAAHTGPVMWPPCCSK